MKVLVTGGTGFIGSNLAEHLLKAKNHVKFLGLVRNAAEEANARRLTELGGEPIIADLASGQELEKNLVGVDLIYHLAAAQHEMGVPDSRFIDVNVRGTKLLLAAAIDAGVRRFIYGSSIGVYGDAQSLIGKQGLIDEKTPPAPQDIYQKTKFDAEQEVMKVRDQIDALIIRISETYGPHDLRLLKLFRMVDKGMPFIFGDGKNRHHPIYISDLVEGFLLAAKVRNPNGDVIVLAGRDVVTTKEMIQHIANALDRKSYSIPLPLWPFMTIAWLFEKILRPFGIAPPLHRRRMNFFVKEFEINRQKAYKVLNFEPKVKFIEGSQLTAEWYRKANLLERNNTRNVAESNVSAAR